MSKQAKSFTPFKGDGPLVDVVVGLAATYCIGSDQYGGTLIEVSNTGHKVVWQRKDERTGAVVAGFKVECTFRAKSGEYGAKGSKYGYLKLDHAKTILDQGF